MSMTISEEFKFPWAAIDVRSVYGTGKIRSIGETLTNFKSDIKDTIFSFFSFTSDCFKRYVIQMTQI